MFPVTAATSIYLYRGAADLRQGFDGLSGLVRTALAQDPLSGALYVFCNRRRTMVKILYWAGDGLCVWHKRLEAGTFRMLDAAGADGRIDRRSLMLLLEGVTPRRLHRRYQRRA
jgi:transposase